MSQSRSTLNGQLKRWPTWLLLLFVVVGFLAVGASRASGPRTPSERVEAISKRVACPVCDGESVFESRNPTSDALRQAIQLDVDEGLLSDDEIIGRITAARDGQERLVPSADGIEALAWALPATAFVVAVAGLTIAFRRWQDASRRLGAATDDDYALVAEAMEREEAAPDTAVGDPHTPMNPDRLAELEDERRFLLRSLTDLEREHDAGDVDEVDYRELKDGYTVRAAATLRAIEGERSSLPAKQPANWRRRAATAVSVVGLIALVWWALAASSAQRAPGQQITGFDPRTDRQVLLSQARALQFEQPGEAAVLYGLVLEEAPNDVEALTYRGWTLALEAIQLADAELAQAQLIEAIDSLGQAVELDPDYPDPRCFLGIVQSNFLGEPAAARADLELCLAANPPADVRGLVEGLLEQAILAEDVTDE